MGAKPLQYSNNEACVVFLFIYFNTIDDDDTESDFL